MRSNYNGRGGPKKQDGKIADKFRDVCPPHKFKDLDSLVKQCKGDESKIQAKIAEWWEEPQIEEPQWESVGKANRKNTAEKKDRTSGDRDRSGFRGDRERGGVSGNGRRGDRPYGGGGGRDCPRRDGRGGGRISGGRYGDRDRNRGGDRGSQQRPVLVPPAQKPKKDSGVPAPVTNVPGPKGAWGSGGQSFAAAAAATSVPKQPAPAAPSAQAPVVPEPKQQEEAPTLDLEEELPVDLGGPLRMISPEDPTPSGLPTLSSPMAPPVATGNVWGTKGGAHLIQAEKKPIPPPVPPAPPVSLPVGTEIVVEPEPDSEPEAEVTPEKPLPIAEKPLSEPQPELEPETEPESTEPESTEPEPTIVKEDSFGVSLDSVLPPSVNGANINASGWEPILDPAESSQQPSLDISHTSPVGAISVGASPSMPDPEPMSLPKPISSSPPTTTITSATGVKPSSVLNMGHWETGDGDDETLDFGFGSFAPENETEAAVTETTASSSSANASSTAPSTSQPAAVPESTHLPAAAPPATASHASPARPPPGLSMPPMPANAMLVHELENKLENTTLGGPKVDANTSVSDKTTATTTTTTHSTTSQPQSFNAVNELAGQMNPPSMSQYGMGMYSIPPPGVPNGLGSMPPGQFPLDSGNSQQQQSDSRPSNPSSSQLNQGQQQQQGPYGMQQTSSTASNNSGGGNDTSGPVGAPSNMPPGMPSMQYQPNPAHAYLYPSQFNQMGHPAYGAAAMQAAYGAYGQQPPFAPPGPQGGHQFYGGQGLMAAGHQGASGGYGAPSHYDDQRGPGGPRGGGGNMRENHQGGGGGYQKSGGRGGYRGNRGHHQSGHASGGYGNNYQGNPNLGGYGAGPYNMGYGHGAGYGNPAGPAGMDHYGMQQQQQQQGGGGVYGGGGFSHQDNDHNKKSSGGPHAGAQQSGGFQQQSHIHQQPLGLQSTSTDTGTASTGGWPGSRQQNWGGNWQQEN